MSETTEKKNPLSLESGPLDVVKHRWIYLAISALLLVPGIVFLVLNTVDPEIGAPVRLGIDFRGGTLLEYGFSKEVTQQDLPTIRDTFAEYGYSGAVVQIQEPRVGINEEAVEIGQSGSTATDTTVAPSAVPAEPSATTAVNTDPDIKTIVSVRSKQLEGEAATEIQQALQAQFGDLTVLQKNSIGPALANELMINGLIALLLAYLLIMGYLSFRFQLDFAVCAMIALIHDTLTVIGIYAILGNLYGTEIDSLFITAVLTVIGFSVHDTIVVFDRIRENSRIYFTKKIPFNTIVNASVNQTLARSINTSLTALLPLTALYFWGGETTRDFVLAIILGIAIGTYSSIFIASMTLAWWRERNTPGSNTKTVATA